MTCQKFLYKLSTLFFIAFSVACLSAPSKDASNLSEELLTETPTHIITELGTEEDPHVTPRVSAPDSTLEGNACSLISAPDPLIVKSDGSLLFSISG